MKKTIIIFACFFLLFVSGCFGDEAKKEEKKSENGVSETRQWSGPTNGPWEEWNLFNNGYQFFKYDYVIDNNDITGWVTIEINDLGNDNYQFEVDVYANNYYNDGSFYQKNETFVITGSDGFYEATYETPIGGSMDEAVYELIAWIDTSSIIHNYLLGYAAPAIKWEAGSRTTYISGTGNETTVHVIDETDVLGIAAFNVELLEPHFDGSKKNYIISPDIRYPLYLYEKPTELDYYYEFTLIEYEYRN